ncbi:MAG TPA: sigma-70 family RNA polymerase sigma factor [Micromonosporaceae bacterium]|jgi:RNA polymerase sigma-70 factor (sigma-E family)|nr:sigma-70 family RNA polymerase sigma factor [Micromonosporaceae bacterium]
MPEQGGRGRDATEAAVGELYHACYRRLVAQVFAFTSDLGEAQDVVQEAFTRALARPKGLSDVDNPEAWLRTVAINVVRRRWRRRKLLDAILLRDRPVARVVQAPPGPERADLRDALATLPQTFREVIVLHYFADLPVEEVAVVLDVPTGTVKSRLSRGRAALAEHLGDYRTEHRHVNGARLGLPDPTASGTTEVAHA